MRFAKGQDTSNIIWVSLIYNATRNMRDREEQIQNSTDSICVYYNERFSQNSCIYSCMINDYYRYIISRWWLSNHSLRIEVGRYAKPKIERKDRICEHCSILEDQFAIFECPIYDSIRLEFRDLLTHQDVSPASGLSFGGYLSELC